MKNKNLKFALAVLADRYIVVLISVLILTKHYVQKKKQAFK